MRIKIIYYKSKYVIEPYDENIERCIKKFCDIIKVDRQNLSFYYKGSKIDTKKNSKEFKSKLMILSAYNLKPVNHDKNFDYILCPGCNNLATINFENDEINMICNKNHIYNEMPFKEFLKKDEEFNKLENCDICGNNESLYGEPLDLCSCGKKICPLCLLIHDPTHNSINFKDKYSSCVLHKLPFIIFCFKCNKNICEQCEYEHRDHKLEYQKKYILKIPDIKIAINNAKYMKSLCKKVKGEIERNQLIINKVINYYKKNIEGYSLLNDYIIKMAKNIQNYETVKNIFSINEYNKAYKILLEKNYSVLINNSLSDRFKIFSDFYESKKYNLTIYYRNNKNDNKSNSITLFNEGFATNSNNKKLTLKIREEKINIEKSYILNKKLDEADISKIRVRLVLDKKVDFTKMFFKNTELIEFDEDEFTNFGSPERIVSMFDGCENLKVLPDLSLMNVSKIKKFDNIFLGCSSLKSLPDISYWQTIEAESMKAMFSKCKSLLYIPDISKWDTSKVNFMDEMFSGCELLISLPNISVWNTSNLKGLNEMLFGCKSLTSFPELSSWNTSSINDMGQIFNECNDFITPEVKLLSKIENDSFLKSITIDQVIQEVYKNEKDKNHLIYKKFCEAVFIISLNKRKGHKKENKKENKKEDNEDQLSVPLDINENIIKNDTTDESIEYKPEIIFKYPLDINERFDLEDLSLSCFSSGIYPLIEQMPLEKRNFMFPFRKNFDKFYLMNFFTYKKIPLKKYYSEYTDKQVNSTDFETETPEKNEINETPGNQETPETSETPHGIEGDSWQIKGYAFIPYCFCIISRFSYINPLQICLKSIFSFYSKIKTKEDYLVFRDMIQFIVNLIPIPPFNKQIKFMIPYYFDYITIDCPKFKDYDLLSTNIRPVLKCFDVSKGPNKSSMIWILRILLNEKNLIIFDRDENRLTKFMDGFLSLLYPFIWINTYIPILNEKNIKEISFSSPFFIGSNISLIDKVSELLKNNCSNNDVIILYLHDGPIEISDFDLSSSLTSNSDMSFKDYFKKFVPDFPDEELYWGLAKILKDKSTTRIKPYSGEAKMIDRLLQEVAIINYGEYISYIEKTKEKKRKPFYLNLSKTNLYDGFIKMNRDLNQEKTKIVNKNKNKFVVETKDNKYFEDILFKNKNKKKEIIFDYELDKIYGKYFINPEFTAIENKYKDFVDFQKIIREKYPEDKTNQKIFENDVELDENDFINSHDKVYFNQNEKA